MLVTLLIDGEAEVWADAIVCPLNQCGAQVPCLKRTLALGFHCAFPPRSIECFLRWILFLKFQYH